MFVLNFSPDELKAKIQLTMIMLSSFQAHKELNVMKYANQFYYALNLQKNGCQLVLH